MNSELNPARNRNKGFTERWIRSAGFLTRYIEAGDPSNDPVLLIHDGAWGACSSVSWGSFISELSDRFFVLAPDLLGFGGSDKAIFLDRSPIDSRIDQLSEFLKTLNIIRPIHLVGNSFGGATALRALARPGSFNFRSVVSIAGAGGQSSRTEIAVRELGRWNGTREDLARVLELIVDDFPGFAEHLSERFRWASVPGHYKAIVAPTTPVPDPLRLTIADTWPEQISDTAVPILLVRGLRDVLLNPSWARDFQSLVPQAQISEIDCKHSPQLDHPIELRMALLEFFDSLPAVD